MRLTRLLRNGTALSAECVPFVDRHGHDVLVVVAKASYEISAQGLATPIPRGAPVRLVEERTSTDRWSSVKLPTDLVDEKPGTDVLLLGTAQPPAGAAVTRMDVTVRVETGRRTLKKTIRVHGPRIYIRTLTGLAMGDPAPLQPTPLVYELAYGGVDESDPTGVLIEPRNPAGTGIAAAVRGRAGERAPQLEDPEAPLTSRSPAPAAFGPVAAHWSPRVELAGTYDEAWRRTRAPVAPVDFDSRHNCVAHRDLWSETPLAGGESVEVLGATPEGAWRFRLPRHLPSFRAIIRGNAQPCPTHLDTVLVDADRRALELTWRACIRLPRKSQFLETIELCEMAHAPRDAPWSTRIQP